MVDIKREDITLSDWTKGISADEYAWGSYFYAEWISSWYNTKWFELGSKVSKTVLNYRNNWYAVALAPNKDYWMVAFTKDWMVETEDGYNWSFVWDWDEDGGWALFSVFWWGSNDYFTNWVSYWDKLICIHQTKISVLNTSSLYNPAAELLTEPKFDNSWAAWTLWTGWTITDKWAEHTTGETGTLSATINFWETPTNSDYIRVALRIRDCTAWQLDVSLNNPTAAHATPVAKSWWVTLLFKCSSSSTTLVIEPTSNFNWIVEIVNVHLYTGLEYQKANVYNWATHPLHPALVWEWDLYVASWNYVSIYSLQDWGRTEKWLVDKNFEIVSMTQQAGNIILRATDGYDSRQYYWNWVDWVATEIIEWKGLIIQWVTGTETVSYVLTASGTTQGTVEWYEYRLYAVNGYQRSLIASKLYQYMSLSYLDEEPYNINKKFEFNDVTGDQSMTVYLDSLYIPGCDGVYKYWYDVPGLRTNWTRPIKYDTGSEHITMWQRNDFLNIGFRVDNVNYLARVNERLYTNKWYLITESIYWDKLSTRKSIEKMKIWYKSLPSTVWNIKVSVIVDDDYFWRFWVSSTPTNRPEVWDIYNVAHDTTGKVINVDKTNWIITFATVNNWWSYMGTANTTLTKVSWAWDDSISVWYKFDNMCLIKTIETEQQWYGSDFIFGKDFVNNYIPYWHKIQFVVEINSNNQYLSPEIYEISLISDINDTVL